MRTVLIALTLGALLVGAAQGQTKASDAAAAQQNARGVALLKEGKIDEAIVELKKAVEASPSSVVFQSNLAYAYDKQGKIDEAVAGYKKVLDLDPANAVVRNNLGALYSKKGLYEDAVREYEEVLQRDAGNATAKTNLDTVVRNRKNAQERQGQIASAVKETEARPTDSRAAYETARVYARLGDNEAALEWLTKALDLGYDQLDFLQVDPSLVGLRKDPRFAKLLEERRPR